MNLIPIIVFIIGAYALTGLRAQEVLYNMTGTIKDIALASGSTVFDVLQGLSPVIITIDVTNSEDVGVMLNGFTGGAYMNGVEVAILDLAINQRINPHETVTLDIPVVLSFDSVMYVIDNYVTDKTVPPLTITGTLTAGGWKYPVNETFNFA